MIDRKRNIDHLDSEQRKELEQTLSSKLTEILSEAGLKANELLKPYGIEVKIAYSLEPEVIELAKPVKAKKAKKPAKS